MYRWTGLAWEDQGVLQGPDGDDGYSPLASVGKLGKTATITITDKLGTTNAQVTDGTTFTPAVSASGVISFSNDGGQSNPEPVDLAAAAAAAAPVVRYDVDQSGSYDATAKARARANMGAAKMAVSPTAGHVATLDSEGNPTDSGYAPAAASGIATLDANTKVLPAQASAAINTQTDSYTLMIGDAGKLVKITKDTAATVTIPLFSSVAFPIGTEIEVLQYGAGTVTIVAANGVTIRSAGNKTAFAKQYASVALKCLAQDEWLIAGYLA